MAEVEYRLLGPVQLLRGGDPVPVGGGRALTLLAALLLSVVVIAVYKDWLLLTPALVLQRYPRRRLLHKPG